MNFDCGQLYYIQFLDHCLSQEHTLVTCEVCLWVLSQDDVRVTGTYWNVVEEDYREGNQEPVNIIKSTILKKRKVSV